MLESSMVYLLIRSLPENILLILSGFILMDLKLDKIKIIKLGLLFSLIMHFVRNLPITFGVHTIISMILLELFLIKLSGEKSMKSIIMTLVIYIALILSEGIYIWVVVDLFGIPEELVMNNTNIKGAISSFPSLIIFLLLIFIIKKIYNKIISSK